MAGTVPIAERIAERILYSADAGALIADAAPASDVADTVTQTVVEAHQSHNATVAPQIQSETWTLAVFDEKLPDLDALLADVDAQAQSGVNIEYLVLDSASSGLSQISQTLASSDRLYDSVQIITHGEAGSFELGNDSVSGTTLPDLAERFGSWAQSLTQDADLLIYGCDLVASPAGTALIDAIAGLTGADVAASQNTTGHQSLGGDWELETQTGSIEAVAALSAATADNWVGTLDVAVNPGTIPVNETTSGSQRTSTESGASQIATNGSSVVVVWEDAATSDIYFRLFDNDGTAQGSEQVITDAGNFDRTAPSVAMNASGDFIIVWTASDQDDDDGGIYAQRFLADGSPVARPGSAIAASGNGSIDYENDYEFRINREHSGSQYSAAVGLYDNGRFIVTWVDENNSGDQQILHSTFDAQGDREKGTDQVASDPAHVVYETPVVAVDNTSQHAAIAYIRSFKSVFDPAKVYLQTVNENGDNAALRRDLAGLNRATPSIAMNDNGMIAVAWRTDIPLSTTRVYLQTFNLNLSNVGGTNSSAITPDSGDYLGAQSRPSLAMDQNGNIVAAWQTDTDGSGFEIYSGQFDFNGNDVGSPVHVNTYTDGSQHAPQIALYGDQTYVAYSGRSPADINGVSLVTGTFTPVGLDVQFPNGQSSQENGGNVEFLVSLDSAPIADVTLEATIDPASDEGALSLSSHTFTSANWNTPVSILVIPTDDTDQDGDQTYTIRLSTAGSADSAYQGMPDRVINWTNLDNDAPVPQPDDNDPSDNLVAENAVAGTEIGITAFAADPDAGDTVTYSIINDANGRFVLADATTGVVTVGNGANLDYETETSHTIRIRATSSDGSTAARNFTVNVSNVNEPVANLIDSDQATPNRIAEDATAGTATGLVAQAIDPDSGSTVQYTIVNNPGNLFSIDDPNSGVVTLRTSASLDFEASGAHTITIRATSSDLSFVEADFVLTVDDANDQVSSIDDSNGIANSVQENAVAGTEVNLTALATDQDAGETVAYSLASNPNNWFAIDAGSGVVTVATSDSIDFESSPTQTIRIRATSTDNSTSEQDFVINIVNINESVSAIVDTNLAANSVAENATAGTLVGIQASASDPDAGDVVSYSVESHPGNLFTIADAGNGIVTVNAGASLDFETTSNYLIWIRSESTDGSFVRAQMSIDITDVNEAISGIADTDSAANSVPDNAAAGASVGIIALANDPDPADVVTYSLVSNPGNLFEIADASSGAITVISDGSAVFNAGDSHTIRVRAESTDSTAVEQDFTISVTTAISTDLPISAITDGNLDDNEIGENALAGTLVQITALATDPNGADVITYSLDANPDNLFAIADSSNGIVTLVSSGTLNFEQTAQYTITVRAESSDGSFSTQDFTIDVLDENDSISAVADTDGSANAIREDAVDNTIVGITASANDTDAGDNISYSLTSNPGNLFAIDAISGVVTMIDTSTLDFETTPDYQIEVEARSDDNTTSTQTFTISVLNANENISAVTDSDGGSGNNIVAENSVAGTPVGLTAIASDPDAGSTVIYSIVNDPANLFSISNATDRGVVSIRTGATVDFEAAASHLIRIRATSSDGSFSEQDFNIAVANVNEPLPPLIDADANANVIAENSPGGTGVNIEALANDPDTADSVTYSIADDASGLFEIADSNKGIVTLRVAASLDFEAAQTHTITVRAESSDGSFSEATLVITVQDRNESISALNDDDGAVNVIAEDAPAGTVAGITALADDQDAGDTVSYAIINNPGNLFVIDNVSGVVSRSGTGGLDFETNPALSITIRATSTDGSTTDQAFAIAVADGSDPIGPLTDTDSTPNRVVENAANGTLTGITVRAIDPDASDTVSYTITGGATSPFAIDSSTGTIRVADGSKLDYEADASHTFEVVATSTDSSTRSHTFTIGIVDVNDAPTAGSRTLAIPETLPATLSGAVFSFSDQDAGDSLTAVRIDSLPALGNLTLAGVPVSLNQLVLISDINADLLVFTPIEHAVGSPYTSFQFRVQDSQGALSAGPETVTFNVFNTIDYAPVISSDGGGERVSIALPDLSASVTTVQASDPDSATLVYSVTGGADASAFTIDVASGVLSFTSVPSLAAPGDNNGDSIYEVTVRVSDGVQTDEQALLIGVGVDPDVFSVQWSGSQRINEDQTTPWGQKLSFTDPLNSASMEMRISVASGALSLGSTTGLSFAQGDGQGDTVMRFSGSSADLAAALRTLDYRPDADVNGVWSAQAILTDLSMPSRAASADTVIDIVAINDLPRVSGSLQSVAAPGTATVLGSSIMSAVDIEDSAADLRVVLVREPAHGSLLLDGQKMVAGSEFVQADWLAGRISYRANDDAEGIDSFDLLVEDSSGDRSGTISVKMETITTSFPPTGPAEPPAAEAETSDDELVAEDDDIDEADDREARANAPSSDADADADGARNAVTGQTESTSPEPVGRSQSSEELMKAARREWIPVLDDALRSTEDERRIDLPLDQLQNDRRYLIDQVDFASDVFGRQLESMRNEVFENTVFDRQVVASSIAVSSGLSIGYVLWLIRSGALISSVLASLPAWRSIDPLPVLNSMSENAGEPGDDESIKSMLEDARNARSTPQPSLSNDNPAAPEETSR